MVETSPSRSVKGHSWNSAKVLFGLLLFTQLVIAFLNILTRRFPGGHDGFQYVHLQYYFLNNVVNAGDVPHWMPFMTQGTVATWWYAIQAGVLQNVFLFLGPLLKSVNFLTLFHLNILFDHLILLTGTWLLAKRFLSAPAVFYVTLTVVMTSVWELQPWFNFHFYYAIPLILHFLHCFFETGRWPKLFLGMSLLLLQVLGNLPYFIPVTTLTVFLYFVFYFLFNVNELKSALRKLRGTPSAAVFMLLTLILGAAVFACLSTGIEQIANYNVGRGLNMQSSLKTFLTYAKTADIGNELKKWTEIILGISPSYDYTVYMGYLTIPLLVVGIFAPPHRRKGHLILLSVFLVLFSLGTVVSAAFYYIWPLAKFFRHLILVIPIIKLFLCFIAGFGLDHLLSKRFYEGNSMFARYLWYLLVIMSGVFCLIHLYLLCRPGLAKFILDRLVVSGTPFFSPPEPVIAGRLAIVALVGVIGFGLTASIHLLRKQLPYGRFIVMVSAIILTGQFVDVSCYRLGESRSRSFPLTEELYQSTSFTPMPYARRRDLKLSEENPRYAVVRNLVFSSAMYWSTQSFLFADQLGSSYRVDHWLKPLDSLMRAYWRQPIDDLTVLPQGFRNYPGPLSYLEFPSNSSLDKIAGYSEDKIQFFSAAYPAEHDQLIADQMTRDDFQGDNLFVSIPVSTQGLDLEPSKDIRQADFSSDRLSIPYEVTRFDSDHLRIDLNNPSNRKIWMMYSDVWHPLWKVSVNGHDQAVFKADLAYKAVQLQAGRNEVHFYFRSGALMTAQMIIQLFSVFWFMMVLRLVWDIRSGRNPTTT